MSTSVAIHLRSMENAEQTAWVAMSVAPEDDPRQVRIDLDPCAGVSRDSTSFLHPLTASQGQVVKSEMIGGILMGRKQLGGCGMTVRLLYMGGSVGDVAAPSAIPSVAYAVAALTAVVHCLGDDAQRADLRGGFGWRLDRIDPA